MVNAGKMIFTFLIFVTALCYVAFRIDATVFDTNKSNYVNAIESATQVATMQLIDTTDVNTFYDGNLRDVSDIPIDHRALNVFRETMERVIESTDQEGVAGITNINIPLAGFITYDYIVGITYTNQYLIPHGYTYEMDSSLVDSRYHGTWNFTLGNIMSITAADGTKKYYSLSDRGSLGAMDPGMVNTIKLEPENIEGIANAFLTANGFATAEQFSDYIVMATINDYLTTYAGADFNNTARHTGTAIDFELGKTKFSTDMVDYTLESGVIDGPGIFSIVDVYTGSDKDIRLYERVASLGGCELVEKQYDR